MSWCSREGMQSTISLSLPSSPSRRVINITVSQLFKQGFLRGGLCRGKWELCLLFQGWQPKRNCLNSYKEWRFEEETED